MSLVDYQWTQSTEEQVREFYRTEFPEYIDSLPSWITPGGPKQYGIALDSKYPAISDRDPTREFVRRSTQTSYGQRFDDWNDLLMWIRSPAHNDPLRAEGGDKSGALVDPDLVDEHATSPEQATLPYPDSIHAHLDHNERFWILAFDVDAKDIAIQQYRGRNDDRTIGEIRTQSGLVDRPPAGYKYEFEHIDRALEYAFEIKQWLHTNLNFNDVLVFYSGQGAHIYAVDDDPQHRYTHRSRRVIASYVTDHLRIPIDKSVTYRREGFLRIPYSLNTAVSRIVTPVSSPETFDPRTDAKPEFLRGGVD